MSNHETYPITIAGVHRELRKFEVAPGLTIAVLNILGDTELVNASARELATKLETYPIDYLVTAEAKSIPLAHTLSAEMNTPYIVLRKTHKPYMGDALKSETLSITTGKPQTLYLDEKDRQAVAGTNVCLLDDVISTGSTLQGMKLIMSKANAKVTAEAAILTEGDRAKWKGIVALGHLPVWFNADES